MRPHLGTAFGLMTAVIAGLLAGGSEKAHAQVTWLGGTSTAWTTGANWDGGVAPTTSQVAAFGSEFGTFQPSLTSGTVAGLQFFRPEGGWTITTSGTLTVSSVQGLDDSLNTSGTTTFNGNVLPGNGSTWTVGEGGTVRVTNRLILGSSGHTFTVVGGLVAAGSLSGGGSNGNMTKAGSGTLVVSGSSTNVAQFTIRAGTVVLGHGHALGSSSAIRGEGGTIQSTIDLTGANAIPKSILLANTSAPGLIFSGTQSIQISGSTYMGTSSTSALPTLTNNIASGKTLTLGNVTGNSAGSGLSRITFAGSGHTIITGSMTSGATGGSNYLKAGSGTLTLQGVGVFTGTMALTEGTLRVENAAALGTTAPFIITGGTLHLGDLNVTKTGIVRFSGGLVSSGTLTNDTQAFDGQSGTVSATLAGTGGLTKSTNGLLVLSGSNSYTGVTTLSGTGGTLQFATRNALYGGGTANWTAANINTGTLSTLALNVGGAGEFSSGDVTTLLASLGGLGGAVNNDGLRAGARIGFDTTNAPGGTFTIADNLANSTGTGGGTLGVTKLGSGTLTLSGTNTYTGPTRVEAGVLRMGSATAFGSGNNVVLAGGEIDLSVFGATVGTLTVGGTDAAVTGSGTLTVGGNVTYTSTPTGGRIETGLDLGGAARTFTVGGDGTGSNALTVSGPITSAGGITKVGTGRLVLDGTSSFTGKTALEAGVLEIASVADAGTSSALGAATGTNARIDLGTGTTVPTLRYVGGGHETNRGLYLAGGTGGGAILEAAGPGAVMFTGSVTAAAGAKTLTLTGTSTADNTLTRIGDAVGVDKTGPGVWRLTGTSTFTRQVRVLEGTLLVSGTAGRDGNGVLGADNESFLPTIGAAETAGPARLTLEAGSLFDRDLVLSQAGFGLRFSR
jgi:fibronectin-binding autotransporter adhesin